MLNNLLSSASKKWLTHDFYSSAVVLGIDIGLEGIGLYLRNGPREVYAKTILFPTPEAKPLAKRRLFRSSRHARKNRKTRLKRLKALFLRHGLPWISEQALAKSDPYKLRHRAVTSGLASPEALSICIRSCVMRRGYDYGLDRSGQFPWGESNLISDARRWIESSFITKEIKEEIEGLFEELEGKNREQSLKHLGELLCQRYEWSTHNTIEAILEAHSKGGHDNLRLPARGYNFPRSQVWEHLKRILRHPRHASFIPDAETFIAELGLNPNEFSDPKASARARKKAIFFYNRKTRFEMEQHWRSKINHCPFALHLGLQAGEKCAENSHPDVRRWKLLEFLSTRRIELAEKARKGATRRMESILHLLSSSAIKQILRVLDRDISALSSTPVQNRPAWSEVDDIIQSDLPPNFRPTPQTKSAWNKDFYNQLRNLVLPRRANLSARASLGASSAKKLFEIATGNDESVDPGAFAARLKEIGFYNWRRQTTADFNPYKQVEFLLGQRLKRGARRGELSASAQGFLRRLFASLAPELDGKIAPDYCVIEVVGDIPRNKDQRKAFQQNQEARAEQRSKIFEKYDREDSGAPSSRRRIALYEQQGGICPFTGLPLPVSPFDPLLEIEHLFPQTRGGLSCDENLALTWRVVNAAKGERTPFQAVATPVMINGESHAILSLDKLLAITAKMRWSPRKREIFAWGSNSNQSDPECHFNPDGSLKVPSFGSPTRVSQLARQLRAEVARWMNLDGPDHVDELARRVGTPSGWLTAQARKSWLEAFDYSKIRSQMVHHLIDAAIVAHIPPREGLNHVNCGGIFYSTKVPVSDQRGEFNRIMTHALPELSPAARLKQWLSPSLEYSTCPVLMPRCQSKMSSLGDSTFWRQPDAKKPNLAQRTKLDPATFPDGRSLRQALELMNVGRNKAQERDRLKRRKVEDNIPSAGELQKWLDNAVEAAREDRPYPTLTLRDGTPVKSVWKWDSKGTLRTGLGWSGSRNENGAFKELRSLYDKVYRLEIWLGYDHSKAAKALKSKHPDPESQGWVFQKRLVPDPRSLMHLKQLGLNFSRDKRKTAPPFTQKLNSPQKTLRELITGKPLLPFSKRVGFLRRGDMFELPISKDGGVEFKAPVWKGHYRVSAIESANGGTVEFTCLVLKEVPAEFPIQKSSLPKPGLGDAAHLASVLGLGSAFELAKFLGRRIPAARSEPVQQRKNTSPISKQPDLGI